MRYRLMHVSDLHAGWAFNTELAAQVVREAEALKPDLLVISGDMVQRADFIIQWKMISSYLKMLPEPKLVIPGNHDVSMFNVFNRLFRPLARYKRYISADLNPVFALPGLVVVGGNTAHGLTIDGGKLSRKQMTILEQTFSRYGPDVCKIAVLHHHVITPPGSEGRTRISNAMEAAELLDRCGVELLLCGHIHVSYVGTTRDLRPDLRQGTIICESGTTTSRRGRGREAGRNSYNVIEIDDAQLRITQHMYLDPAGRFAPVAEYVFPRQAALASLLPAPAAAPHAR